MSVLPILTWPDPRLSQRCAPVRSLGKPMVETPPEPPIGTPPETTALITNLFDTMYAASGRGLAAPQVGVLQRIFVMDCGWKDDDPTPKICINPEILQASEVTSTRLEGCLSLPGVTADVIRPAQITLRSVDLQGRTQDWDLTGFEATCAQHELDHLDGVITFDRVDQATRAALEARYSAALA